MKEYAEVLRDARALIADEARWIKGHFALDEDGEEVPSHSRRACKFCLVGAVRHAAMTRLGGNELAPHCVKLGHMVIASLPTGKHTWMASEFNDNPRTTHADALGVLDRAIERAEEAT